MSGRSDFISKTARQKRRGVNPHTIGFSQKLRSTRKRLKGRRPAGHNPKDDAHSEITQTFLKTHRPQAANRPQPSLPKITMSVVDW